MANLIRMRPVLKLLSFLLPRGVKVWEKEFEDIPIIHLLSDEKDLWENLRNNEEVVKLFYETLDHMDVKVPDYLRVEELDWALCLRILDYHHPKPVSFVGLALQLGINKDTLKKTLSKVEPELARKLRNRKKLSFIEHYEIVEVLGVYKEIAEDEREEEIFDKSPFIRRSDMYELLNTDKKTLEANLPEALKNKITELNRIPPVLYKEVKGSIG